MSDWVRHKFDWLCAVAADPKLGRLPVAIAILLAVKYFNSERGGEA